MVPWRCAESFVVNEDDVAWLAGLIDAEGSLGLRRVKTRKSQIFCQAFVGMVDRRAVERAKRIAEGLYGAPLAMHERKPKGLSRRPFFSFNMVAKKELFVFLRTMVPYLRAKRVEGLLQYDFLSRAAQRRHVGTEHDAWLCEMSEQIKRGCEAAPVQARERVRDDLGKAGSDLAWLAGYTDGDGSISAAVGAKAVFVTYGARKKTEIEAVRMMVSSIVDAELPSLREQRNPLSKHAQWTLYLRDTAVVVSLLKLLRPHLYSKQAQADLALLVRSTDDLDVRNKAIALIQDLNQGRLGHDDVQSFLASHSAPV